MNVIMETHIFDQQKRIVDAIDNWQSQSIDIKIDRVTILGKPEVRFDGTSDQIKLVMLIERVEVIRRIHPLALVNSRPSSGRCMMDLKGVKCPHRRDDGQCTSDPINHETKDCKYRDGDEFEPVWMEPR